MDWKSFLGCLIFLLGCVVAISIYSHTLPSPLWVWALGIVVISFLFGFISELGAHVNY